MPSRPDSGTTSVATPAPKDRRQYVLAGRLSCGRCGRRMEGTWNHDRPTTAARSTATTLPTIPTTPATIYVREDSIVPQLDSWVAELFTDEHLDGNCAKLAQRRPTRHRPGNTISPDPGPDPQARQGTRQLPHHRAHRTRSRLTRRQTGSPRPTRNAAGSKPCSVGHPRPSSPPRTSRPSSPASTTSPLLSPSPTRRTRPGSMPRWGSTSPTTKTASSSNPGRV